LNIRRKVYVTSMLLLLASAGLAAQEAARPERDGRAKELKEKAEALIEQRKSDEAIPMLQEAAKMEPGWSDIYLDLGSAYMKVFFEARRKEFEEKAIAALNKAAILNPKLPQPSWQLGVFAYQNKHYEDSIPYLGLAIKADPKLTFGYTTYAYTCRWQAMLKRADFEREIPVIRLEIEDLLNGPAERRAALSVAGQGYQAIGDEESLKRVDDLMLLEFPQSERAQDILRRRAFDETDEHKQAALIEDFTNRFPGDYQAGNLYDLLFRIRAADPGAAGETIAKIGDEWIRRAPPNAFGMIGRRSTLVKILSERRIELDHAQAIADEIVTTVDSLAENSPLLQRVDPAQRAAVMISLKEQAHSARGFVSLRRGKLDDASKELNSALASVIAQVERNDFLLSSDVDLLEVGVRPRVLWLAELFEAQGDYSRAAKYLLAGYSEDAQGSKFVRERLPVVYRKLGRPVDISSILKDAERLYLSRVSESRTAEEEKKMLLATRTHQPAPDFRVTTLGKKEIRLADLKGKVVVLNFWATWCGPCVEEMPYFEKAVERYKGIADVIFLAVSTDDNRALVRPFVQKKGYRMMVAYDEGAAEALNVRGIPATFIIDRSGVIQFQDSGFGGAGKDYVRRLSWRVDLLKEETAGESKQR
jgi:thiol-disulfide isomerase/thioredoxin